MLARGSLPTIRFLPDGSIGDNSPQMLLPDQYRRRLALAGAIPGRLNL